MSTVHHCDLCGSPAAAFRCERCYNQLFCPSCDDVFHRHPKRITHIRQAIENFAAWNMEPARPPLPPKTEVLTLPAPIPPPRRHRMQAQHPQQQQVRIPFASRQSSLPARMDTLANSGSFFHHSAAGSQRQMHQHADGLISMQENGDDDRPPTPPPISTIPRSRYPVNAPFSSKHQGLFQGISNLGSTGPRWKSSAMHMSCGNLATPGVTHQPDTVFGSIALGPRSNFPQQHLVQKPALPTARSRLMESSGFNVSRPVHAMGSIPGRVPSRESLVHDPWGTDAQGNRKLLLSSNSKGPDLGTWRGSIDSGHVGISRPDPRPDNSSRMAPMQTLPAANRLPDWGINAGLGKQQYSRPQQPLRGGYRINSGSVMSLNTLPNPDTIQSRSPSRIMAAPKMHQAHSMANLTCPSCQGTTIWGREPGEIEDRALSVMGRPYPSDEARKFVADMEKARNGGEPGENNPEVKAMQLMHSAGASSEMHARARASQRKKSFPLPSPRRAPSVDVISEWMPQPELPGPAESLRRRLTKSAQRSRQKSRHYARSVPPRSSSDDSEDDYYSIGRSEEEDFHDSVSMKNLSSRTRASPQPPRSMPSMLSIPDATSGKWQCKYCTFLNQPNSKICGICSKTNANVSVPKSSHPAVRHSRFKKHVRRSNTDQLIHSKDMMETVSLPPPEKEQSRCSSSLSSELDETQADDPPLILPLKKPSTKQSAASTASQDSTVKPSTLQQDVQYKAEEAVELLDDTLERKVHQLVIHSPVVSLSNESSPHEVSNPPVDSDGAGEIVSGNVTLRAVTDAEIQVAGIQENASSAQKTQSTTTSAASTTPPPTRQCISKGTSPPPIEIGTQTMEEEIFYEASNVLPPRNPISDSSNLNKATEPSGMQAISTLQLPHENSVASGMVHQQQSFGQNVQLGYMPIDNPTPSWNSNMQQEPKFYLQHSYPNRGRSHSAVMPPTGHMRDPTRHSFDVQFRGVTMQTPQPSQMERSPYLGNDHPSNQRNHFKDAMAHHGMDLMDNSHQSHQRHAFKDPMAHHGMDLMGNSHQSHQRNNFKDAMAHHGLSIGSNDHPSHQRSPYNDTIPHHGMELVNIFREAEHENFRAEDLEIALLHCGSKPPIRWLKENWPGMVRTVQSLTSDYQTEMDGPQNSVGRITVREAEQALRNNKGNVWASVVECTQQRKEKLELFMQKYPNVEREEIVSQMERWSGDAERIELELAKAQFKPIFMQIMAPRGRDQHESRSQMETPSPYSLPFHALTSAAVSRDHTMVTSTPSNAANIFRTPLRTNTPVLAQNNLESRQPEIQVPALSEIPGGPSVVETTRNAPGDNRNQAENLGSIATVAAFSSESPHIVERSEPEPPQAAVGYPEAIVGPTQSSVTDEPATVVTGDEPFHEAFLEIAAAAPIPEAVQQEPAALEDHVILIEPQPVEIPTRHQDTLGAEQRASDSPKREIPTQLPAPSPAPQMSLTNNPATLATPQTTDAYTLSTQLAEKPVRPEFERKVRRLLAEGLVRNYKEGEIAAKLMELDFSESNCIHAARECDSLYTAITYLQQSCEICLLKVPINQMVSMLHCTHRCCRSCAKVHFTNCIKERSILEIKCPFCDQPNLQNDDVAQEYFSHLEIILKNTVDEDAFNLHVQKLRDWSLMKDPAFRWCAQCSSGFIRNSDRKKHECPECKAVFCADCDRPWTREHDDLSCQQYLMVLERNGEDQMQQAEMLIEEELKENGIECPNCHFRYLLARGGCMHFTCVQCRYEFCSGCDRPFHMGSRCPLKSDLCAKLGLHAHHPRNCLFYLRDKEPRALQKLLKEYGIDFKQEAEPIEPGKKRKCVITEVRETPSGMEEHVCGDEAPDGHAGLCQNHYVEYLGGLIRRSMLDPVSIMSNDDLEVVIRRANLRMPFRAPGETPEEYRPKLLKLIEESVPLDGMNPATGADVEGAIKKQIIGGEMKSFQLPTTSSSLVL